MSVETPETLTSVPTGTPIADNFTTEERTVEDRLLDEPSGPLSLSTGLEVELRPLKLREFLKLLRIITRGGAALLPNMTLDFNDPESFGAELIALILFSVPEAPDEVSDFLATICKPTGLSGNADNDNVLIGKLIDTFDNPELEDVIEVVTRLVQTESKDLAALGKRLQGMLKVAQKVGALDDKPGQTTR